MDNIIFEHSPKPQKDKVCHDDTLAHQRQRRTSIVSSIITCILFIVFSITYNTFVFFIFFLSLMFLYVSLKHQAVEMDKDIEVYITATDDKMNLVTIDVATDNILCENSIEYATVKKAYFNDKACRNLTIVLYNNARYKFRIKKYSHQQYFFLYVAPEYFNLSNPTAIKILKYFGSEKHYLQILKSTSMTGRENKNVSDIST